MFAKNRGIYRKLKGQYTLYALFMTFVTIVCFSVLYAPLKAIIDDAVPGMNRNIINGDAVSNIAVLSSIPGTASSMIALSGA
jgi:hypothetical protein